MKRKFRIKKRFRSLTFIIVLMVCFCSYKIVSNFIINKKLFSNEQLINYLIDEEYYKKEELNIFKKILNKKEEIIMPTLYYVSNNISPRVYIYNSHQQERYTNNTILSSSQYLQKELEKNNITSTVLEEDLVEFMNMNNYNFASSYKASRIFIEDIISKYPNIELFIDIHRDSIKKNESVVTINNKSCAKILFVVGLEHTNYSKNLKVTTDINKLIEKKYNNLSRGVLTKKGSGVNGIYNQDLSEKVILIEIGGYENSFEEVKNTIELISPIIGEYINGK